MAETGYMPIYGTYSFADVSASINGPGGDFRVEGSDRVFNIAGPDVASAEEGITIAPTEETNTMTIGADGSVMHSLHQSRAATCTVRLMKISPINEKLMTMYNRQRASSALWGKNTITLDVGGDHYNLIGCAFARFPSNSYSKVGNVLEWEFNVAIAAPKLGRTVNLTVPGTTGGGAPIGF